MRYLLYKIPGACPGEILKQRPYYIDGHYLVKSVLVNMHVYGPEIEINLPLVNSLYVGNYPNVLGVRVNETSGGTNDFTVFYYIDVIRATDTPGATETNYYIKAHLAAAQTLATAVAAEAAVPTESTPTDTAVTSFKQSNWSLSRWSASDSNLHAPQAVPCSQQRKTLVNLDSAGWSSASEYCAVLTIYAAGISSDQAAWQHAGFDDPDPISVVLGSVAGGTFTPYTGTTALTALMDICSITSLRSKVYRMQMIPYTVIVNMIDTVHTNVYFNVGEGQVRYGRYLRSWEATSTWWQPNIGTRFARADVNHLLSYGDPQLILEYAGQVLGKFSVFQCVRGHAATAPRLRLGATLVQGVNLYARVLYDDDPYVVTAGLISIPTPEIIGAVDGLSQWYETVGRNLITQTWTQGVLSLGMTMASTVAGAALTGGAGIAMAGLAVASQINNMFNQQRQIDAARTQAENSIITAGAGPSNFFAHSSSTNHINAMLETIDDAAVAENEAYFRRQGYAGAWTVDNVMATPRAGENYYHVQGVGNIQLLPAAMLECCVDARELCDAINAEIGQGVTVWTSTSIGSY